MNFLIFASPLGRAKIMRIHTHEWKLITLIFENEWYYDVIPRYKENKQTNKQQTNNQSKQQLQVGLENRSFSIFSYIMTNSGGFHIRHKKKKLNSSYWKLCRSLIGQNLFCGNVIGWCFQVSDIMISDIEYHNIRYLRGWDMTIYSLLTV